MTNIKQSFKKELRKESLETIKLRTAQLQNEYPAYESIIAMASLEVTAAKLIGQ